MNPLPPEERWQRFAAAARQGAATVPLQPIPNKAPSGFVARVVAQAMQARREFLALLWERWSWRLALVVATVAVVFGGLVLRHARQARLDVPSVILEVPPLEAP